MFNVSLLLCQGLHEEGSSISILWAIHFDNNAQNTKYHQTYPVNMLVFSWNKKRNYSWGWKAAARCNLPTLSPYFLSLDPGVPASRHEQHITSLCFSFSAPLLWLWSLVCLLFLLSVTPCFTTVLSESKGFMASWTVILDQTPILRSFVNKAPGRFLSGDITVYAHWYLNYIASVLFHLSSTSLF